MVAEHDVPAVRLAGQLFDTENGPVALTPVTDTAVLPVLVN
jgi:hypothetical protein